VVEVAEARQLDESQPSGDRKVTPARR
jgi:hypothetical protein